MLKASAKISFELLQNLRNCTSIILYEERLENTLVGGETVGACVSFCSAIVKVKVGKRGEEVYMKANVDNSMLIQVRLKRRTFPLMK
jgi:hypothetical protein